MTYEALATRDAGYVEGIDRWFADTVRRQGFTDISVNDPPPPMFTPFRLRAMTLRNRVVVSPMCQYSADDGTVGNWHLVHLGGFAVGGAGLVFSEMTNVSADGRISPGCAGMYKPEHVPAWRRIVEFVHANSAAKICLQLAHAGQKGATKRAWEGDNEPLENGAWPIISASAIRYLPHSQVPRAMDRADMDRVRDDFVRAAGMAEDCGFDMIELHMAHGYLLSSFISPMSNQRDDAYGGPLENRMRFPLEVFDAVRAVWSADKPMSVRISATDWVDDGGLTGDDAVEIAKMLKSHGCDIVDVSAGQTSTEAQPVYGRMFQTPFSDQVRNEAGIPTISVGNITTPDQVNTIVAAGRADLCALARPHLTDPHFTLRAAAHYGHEPQVWPDPYLSAKSQMERMSGRENERMDELVEAAAPPKPVYRDA
jgi:anthraniloyl-CoA monooxygenase